MGCDRGVDGVCIWVYLISWLFINSSAFITFRAPGGGRHKAHGFHVISTRANKL